MQFTSNIAISIPKLGKQKNSVKEMTEFLCY
jgi:hypothetical protein